MITQPLISTLFPYTTLFRSASIKEKTISSNMYRITVFIEDPRLALYNCGQPDHHSTFRRVAQPLLWGSGWPTLDPLERFWVAHPFCSFRRKGGTSFC